MARPGAINKPTVFLSHAATDEPVAKIIHDEIARIFANGVKVFTSSVPGVVEPGADWLNAVRTNLDRAHAVIVLITPVSINRPWIWFEVGASWSRMEQGAGRILPVCVPEIDKSELPEPLSRLQALSLGSATETRLLFKTLCDHFGFGSLKGYKHTTIKGKLPRQPLAVVDSDLASGALYDGPYEGYSTEELREVIDEEFLLPEYRRYVGRFRSPYRPNDRAWREYVFSGELVHFRDVDAQLLLPPGSARALLADLVTELYPATVTQRTENTLRFEVVDTEKQT